MDWAPNLQGEIGEFDCSVYWRVKWRENVCLSQLGARRDREDGYLIIYNSVDRPRLTNIQPENSWIWCMYFHLLQLQYEQCEELEQDLLLCWDYANGKFWVLRLSLIIPHGLHGAESFRPPDTAHESDPKHCIKCIGSFDGEDNKPLFQHRRHIVLSGPGRVPSINTNNFNANL